MAKNTFLVQDILNRAAKISASDVNAPDAKVEKGDKVIGKLPNELKGLWAVLTAATEKLKKFHDQLHELDQTSLNTQEAREISESDSALHLEHDVAHCCFWNSVRYFFLEFAREECIGLREGWKVVICPLPPSSDPLEQLLDGLMGIPVMVSGRS